LKAQKADPELAPEQSTSLLLRAPVVATNASSAFSNSAGSSPRGVLDGIGDTCPEGRETYWRRLAKYYRLGFRVDEPP
jgi:hypothetical protein